MRILAIASCFKFPYLLPFYHSIGYDPCEPYRVEVVSILCRQTDIAVAEVFDVDVFHDCYSVGAVTTKVYRWLVSSHVIVQDAMIPAEMSACVKFWKDSLLM